MRRPRLFLLYLALTALATPAAARDLSEAEYGELLNRIYAGRVGAAAALLDSLATDCAHEPFFLIARARLGLESVPQDDLDKTLAKKQTAPVLDTLQQVIDICDHRLAAGGEELPLRRLRGWAWMVRSQAHAQGRSFYAAGRDAGRGKKDLEFYLAAHPDDPIANGLLGAYLYFTDAVPAIFQLLSKLIFLPTGDRARGLAMIAAARNGPSPKREDFRILSMTVDIVFEGRWEDGLPQALALQAEHPAYPRLALPLAALRLLAPARQADVTERIGRTEAALAGQPRAEADTISMWMGRTYEAWSDRLLRGPALAAPGFAAIATARPSRPDWISEFATKQLAELERDRKDGVPDEWIARVWQAPLDSLGPIMADLTAAAEHSVRAAFYAAECHLRFGDTATAQRFYQIAVAADAAEHLAPYQMVAASRIGELKATAGRYRAASRWYRRAAGFHRDVYRVDWMLEGRARYFDEMDRQGREWQQQSILLSGP